MQKLLVYAWLSRAGLMATFSCKGEKRRVVGYFFSSYFFVLFSLSTFVPTTKLGELGE